MREVFAILSALIILAAAVPYSIDIVKGRAKPARSTRIMFLLLTVLALAQQHSLGSGLALALTVGEIIGSLVIFVLSIKYGVGGLSKLDKRCYALLGIDLAVWAITRNAALALVLTVIADVIAFWPTLYKTWLDPKSETALWFIAGTIAPAFSLLSETNLSFSVALFPLYILVVNAAEAALILWPRRRGFRIK